MNDRLPSFYTPLDDRQPLPVVLPDIQLRSARLDPALLQPGDFALASIQPPANILHAVTKRQAEFLAGRLCACAALSALDGRAQTPAVGEDHVSVWPAAISGSIAHGDHWAAALMATRDDWRRLGLSVEALLETERARCLHDEILAEGGRLRFVDDLGRHTSLLVTLVFSLKEGLFKALYLLVGKCFYFKHAELLEWRADGWARLRLFIGLSPEWRHGSELDTQFAVFGERLLNLVAVGA